MKLSLSLSLTFLVFFFLEINKTVAQSQLGLHIENNQTVLFGKDTTTAGNKVQWHPSKGAFRAGRTSAGEWNYNILGWFSAAFGRDTQARGGLSFAAGLANHAFSYAETSLGRYSLSGINPDPDNWVPGDVLFEIGNGMDDDNRSNALTVLKNGEVLIPGLAGAGSLEADEDGRLVAASNTAGTYAIGDFVQGGVVFWVSPSGDHCKVVSIFDLGRAQFSNNTNSLSYARSLVNGAGNTAAIINQSGHNRSAAQHCADLAYSGYDDWYLPSKDELDEVYSNLATINTTAIQYGGDAFANSYYWSSSEDDSDAAWSQYFDLSFGGYQDRDSKSLTNRVRAIRAF